ncbi:MAG: hypothetical protein M9899_09540 [Bdellovibrionaceae bacterium]|nr:hypothetical protein [Pseudobdellovibrionaceae bacterium]
MASKIRLSEALVNGDLKTSKNTGDLRPQEISAIQILVNSSGLDVFITGSAAKGQRRAIDSDLPLAVFGGSKKDTKSDIDYVVKIGLGDKANRLPFPDVDSSWGVREVDYINLSSGPTILFRPYADPILIEGSGRLYLDDTTN